MDHPSPAAGLYLHVPFCSAICPYCDFSVLIGSPERRQSYVRSLLAEITRWSGAPAAPFGPFDTFYLGGGTPSLLAQEQLAAVLAAAGAALSRAPDLRLTLEANPEDVGPAATAAWRCLGVDTLSLGVQGFDAARLAFLGRRHDPVRARQSIEEALAAGFRAVSVDLIYGLPGEEPVAWRRELEQVVAAGPQHLSCYQLTVHPSTPFGFHRTRGQLTELSTDRQGELFRLTHRFLADHGYEAYEVSSFARAPEHRSRHNQKYWDGTPYLGMGPSAHSFDGRRRFWNHRKIGPWQRALELGGMPLAGEEVLSRAERALEELMLAFRTVAGLDVRRFFGRYGIDLAVDQPAAVDRLVEGGFVTVQEGRLRPTLEGLAVADSLALAFDLSGI